ncbi:nitroreductase family protein [Halobacteriovorax sp. HLS]|uniref:nitroreductase family protein n=1 Tax=Halobacteriovorax sp. HLS TaxID=2234000 RepID=UPI000FD9D9E7|nr:nitroreductase family protein [Halobacteriovorax sp. HLS]
MSDNIFTDIPDTGHREDTSILDHKDFFSVLHSRRSVRVFDDTPVKEEDMNTILESALLAPNSSNLQPWSFFWVKSSEKKQALVEACLSQPAAKTAQELIVCIARTDTWKDNAQEMVQLLENTEGTPAAAKTYYSKLVPLAYSQGPLGLFGLLKRVGLFFVGMSKVTPREPVSHGQMRTWAVKSTALACENIMLSARALGYDSCPMEGADSKRIKELLGLGSGSHFVMVISIGKRAENGVYGPQIRFAKEKFIHIV